MCLTSENNYSIEIMQNREKIQKSSVSFFKTLEHDVKIFFLIMHFFYKKNTK